MKTAGAKAKGRRLQTEVAEALAYEFNLKILAVLPTKAGTRENGVVYVRDEAEADLEVRRMGETGNDVALLSYRAREAVRLFNLPLAIECKNVEAFSLDAKFWDAGETKFMNKALAQAIAGRSSERSWPVVFFSKNRWPTLAVFPEPVLHQPKKFEETLKTFDAPVARWTAELGGVLPSLPVCLSVRLVMMKLDSFVKLLQIPDGA